MADIEGPLPPTEPSGRQENGKTVWQQYQTEDGADYYANTETGRTTWTPKSSAVSGVESETTLETMEDGTMEDGGGIHSSSSGVDAVDVALDTAAPPIVTMQRLKGQEDSEESKDSSSVGGSTSNSSSGGVGAVDVSLDTAAPPLSPRGTTQRLKEQEDSEESKDSIVDYCKRHSACIACFSFLAAPFIAAGIIWFFISIDFWILYGMVLFSFVGCACICFVYSGLSEQSEDGNLHTDGGW